MYAHVYTVYVRRLKEYCTVFILIKPLLSFSASTSFIVYFGAFKDTFFDHIFNLCIKKPELETQKIQKRFLLLQLEG